MLLPALITLAQAGPKAASSIPPEDKAMIHLMLIGAILGIGLLVVIGLVAAWRNYNQRQREIEEARDERDADHPRPDAWATAAQRIEAEDAGPDEAHVSSYEDEPRDTGRGFDESDEPEEDEEDDGDEFPFDRDDDEDDDGPIGRA
jgi:HAMP domain-containing protein